MVDMINIRERHRSAPGSVASPRDFLTLPGGRVELDNIWRDPSISLYCMDAERRRTLFVQTPADLDITVFPFLYEAQYEHAQKLFEVSYDELHELAARHRPPHEQWVFIHSVGRCGSTLLSKAFQEVSTVTSLSEPDVYTQMVALRSRTRITDDELVRLLSSCTRILFKLPVVEGTTMRVVKFRPFCIGIADLLDTAFPGAKHIFLYRDLEHWLTAAARLMPPLIEGSRADRWPKVVKSLASYLPLVRAYLRESSEIPSQIELLTLHWLSIVHGFASAQRDLPMLRVRYEDMVQSPERTIGRVFSSLGFHEEAVGRALSAFARDSQAGSYLSREAVGQYGIRRVSEEERDRVRWVVSRYPLPARDAAALPDVVASMDI